MDKVLSQNTGARRSAQPLGVMRFTLVNTLCITLAGVVLSACAPTVSTAEASALAKDVKPLLNAMCGSGGSVPDFQWPSALAALDPDSVSVTAEGLYARTSSLSASERGVFVACRPTEFVPVQGSDPSYRLVADGVYTYYIAG